MVPRLGFYQHGGDFAQKAEVVLGGEAGCVALEMEEVTAPLSSVQDAAIEKEGSDISIWRSKK